jgi:hypothetical protein
MQVVINIDDVVYKRAMVYKGEQFPDNDDLLGALITAVANGTPLPKSHGRLIDADEINLKDISPVDGFSVYGATAEDIDLTPTVLEADEAEE